MGRHFNRIEEGLMALFLMVMTVLTFTQVVLRYGFNSGFVWSLEATTYSFGWLVVLGISSGIRTNTHIAVDLAVGSLSPAIRRAAALLAVSVCLAYAVLMGYGSYLFVDRLMELGNDARDIPVKRWLLVIILPIGFGLLGLRLVQAGFEIWSGTRKSLGHQEEGSAFASRSDDTGPDEAGKVP